LTNVPAMLIRWPMDRIWSRCWSRIFDSIDFSEKRSHYDEKRRYSRTERHPKRLKLLWIIPGISCEQWDNHKKP
jgi:hypothetical protein